MKKYKFIDLFAGIGGFHLALEQLGCTCVFASEIDEQARKTYIHNFKEKSPNLFDNNMFNADIRQISPEDIPDFDILCAGFPCQPFSQAGHKRGFNDNHKSERGNLFFNIVDILEIKKPQAFFLENVRGLIHHDDGKTFKTIRHILENELGYNFHYKIVKASDYGLPQLRPRTFMIGFKDRSILSNFSFPPIIPLKFNMSDIWEGKCSREIGFTLRVGGRGSNINNKRNWDAYLVDDEIKKIMPIQAKKMQGFPADFEFPVGNTQALKQLGNSVAVDAVQTCAKAMLEHMQSLMPYKDAENITKPKATWAELDAFLKLGHDRKLFLGDKNRADKNGANRDLADGDLPNKKLSDNKLPNEKLNVSLAIKNNDVSNASAIFGIMSFLGSNPTLLNASGNTNFIYEVIGIDKNTLSEINDISTSSKVKDRLGKIYSLGGELNYHKLEKDTMQYNLSMIDPLIPALMAQMILEFFVNRTASINNNLCKIAESQYFQNEDLISLQVKIKRLLISVMLGIFPGTRWNGELQSKNTIIIKNDGEQIAFHIIDIESLEDYLYETIKFDTPSTTRHRYGQLILENDGKLYFKLNLQLRF